MNDHTRPQLKVPIKDPIQKKNPVNEMLSHILALISRIEKAKTLPELKSLIVNDTRKVLPYQQAILFRIDGHSISLEAASNTSSINVRAPFPLWLLKVIIGCGQKDQGKETRRLVPGDLPTALQEGWKKWVKVPTLLYVPLIHENQRIGALLLMAEHPWGDAAIHYATYLGERFAYVITNHHQGSTTPWGKKPKLKNLKAKVKAALLVAALFALFLPVHQSALAPAEIVSEHRQIIKAPLEGVIRELHVTSGQFVNTGDLLATLDDTLLRGSLDTTIKNLGVVKSERNRLQQRSFSDPDAKAGLPSAQAKIDEKNSEIALLRLQLDKSKITAPLTGVVIMQNPDALIGTPVRMGERIMLIANPQTPAMRIELPANDAIILNIGSRVQLFLHTDPTKPIEGVITQSKYGSEVNEQNIVVFPLQGSVNDDETNLHLGLKGTAKVYGEKVSLGYYLFRRPWAAIRQIFGL